MGHRIRRQAAGVAAVAMLLLVPLGPAGASHLFDDVPSDHTFHNEVAWLATADITRGCNPPPNSRFCPDEPVTRGQMAAFLTRALGLTGGHFVFIDTAGHVFDKEVSALADTGMTRGCNPPDNDRFCPDDYVTRGQMATFLSRALALGRGATFFGDSVGHNFALDVASLADAGITRGCNPSANSRFCPDDYVTRGQMAAFLQRALTGEEPGDPATLEDAAVGYFVASEAHCIAYSHETELRPEPARYDNVTVLGRTGPSAVLLEDGTGERLVVDFSYHPPVIYLEEGPDAVLPFDLSFGCDPEVVLGTLSH